MHDTHESHSERPPVALLMVALFLAAVTAVGCSRMRGDGRAEWMATAPPIVFITLDTTRANRLGTYGYFRDTTPALDAFAEEAIVFERAISVMATTLPAHVSLFTGMYPLQTGVVANGTRINALGPDVRFLAQMLSDLGYGTAGFVSASPVKARTGMDAGFEVFNEPEKGQRPGGDTTDLVLRWLGEEATDPSFLWVHYFDPHEPRKPPPGYRRHFRADDDLVAFLNELGITNPIEEPTLKENVNYDAELKYVDDQLARLFQGLRDTGWYDRAVIVVAGDHGEGLGQHGIIGHGQIFNEQLTVPLIVKFPESAGIEPRRYSGLASGIDVLPTIAAAIDLPLDRAALAQFEGIDLLAAQRGEAFSQRTFKERPNQWGEGKRFALQTPEWKYLHHTQDADVLYDLRSDPHESTDVIAQHPERAAEMRDNLLTRLARYIEEGAAMDVVIENSPEMLRELRALGYLQ